MRPDYLQANDAFYSTFWRAEPNYGTAFPNAEEADRGGVILRLLAGVAERERWAAHPPRILDAGCGRGWLTKLVSLYGHAEGCEPVADAVALARSLFPTLTFHASTPGELASRERFMPFDVVVCSEVLEHVPAALQAGFVRDLYRCLRDGGTLVLTTPRGELHSAEGESSQQSVEEWRTEAEVERLLKEAGFVPLERRRAFPTGGTVVERISARLPGAAQRWVRGSWVQVAADHRTSLYQIWCCRRG